MAYTSTTATPTDESSPALEPFLIDLWTPEQCAYQLRMSAVTLRNMGKSGPPKVKLGGRTWYRPDGVRAWLVSREKGSGLL